MKNKTAYKGLALIHDTNKIERKVIKDNIKAVRKKSDGLKPANAGITLRMNTAG